MLTTMSALSSQTVADAAGVTYRQLDHWTRTGVLGCAESTVGSGNRRTYTFDDALVVAVLGRLARIAVRLDVLARVAQGLRELDDFSGLVFVTAGGELHRTLADGFGVAVLVDLDEFGHLDALLDS